MAIIHNTSFGSMIRCDHSAMAARSSTVH